MRKEVADFSVPYLQILDEKGHVDSKLDPKLPSKDLIQMYRHMVCARLFDDKCLKLQRQGRMGTFAPVTGQEAAQVGAVLALKPTDWLVPSFREAAAAIARGAPLSQLALYVMGYPQGGAVPSESRDFPVAIPVGSQTLHAAGIGMAIRIKKEKDVVVGYCGDGATSQGDFYEALNFAGVFAAPLIMIVQNNQWAISLPRAKQSHAQTLAQKGIAAGIECMQVDGNDVLGMYAAVRDAVKRARSGKGPTLIEALTYRMMMHTTADDPTRYRSDKEVNAWKKKDPIDRFRKYLEKKKLWNASKEKKLIAELTQEIEQAITEAESQKPLIDDMFRFVYKEMPSQLHEQLEVAKKYTQFQVQGEGKVQSAKEGEGNQKQEGKVAVSTQQSKAPAPETLEAAEAEPEEEDGEEEVMPAVKKNPVRKRTKKVVKRKATKKKTVTKKATKKKRKVSRKKIVKKKKPTSKKKKSTKRRTTKKRKRR